MKTDKIDISSTVQELLKENLSPEEAVVLAIHRQGGIADSYRVRSDQLGLLIANLAGRAVLEDGGLKMVVCGEMCRISNR